MEDYLNKLLGPSIFLLCLDLFLEVPDQWMNLREIARRVDKNPGSISPIMPIMLEKGLVESCKIGKVSYAYKLNKDNDEAKALKKLRDSLKKITSQSCEQTF